MTPTIFLQSRNNRSRKLLSDISCFIFRCLVYLIGSTSPQNGYLGIRNLNFEALGFSQSKGLRGIENSRFLAKNLFSLLFLEYQETIDAAIDEHLFFADASDDIGFTQKVRVYKLLFKVLEMLFC